MILENQILNAPILIIDDDIISVRMLEDMLKKAGYLNYRSLMDPRDACQAYQKFKPDLILLDINMPFLNGFQVIDELKKLKPSSYLPILIVTEEENAQVKLRSLEAGARDFIHKPYDRFEVLLRIRNLLEVRMLDKALWDQNRILEEKVNERTLELHDTRLDVIHRLARAAEFRDQETGEHIVRMSQYATCLGRATGMNNGQVDLLLTTSPLHDIGKLGIPDSILLKPGKLTTEEFEIMKTHTTIGAKLLGGSRSAFMKMAETIALTHHEKWDGSGYPNHIKENQIPMVGRICGICDVFDALTSQRPYKQPWPFQKAVEEVKSQSGKHFEPYLVETFVKILPEIKNIYSQHQIQETNA